MNNSFTEVVKSLFKTFSNPSDTFLFELGLYVFTVIA